MALVPFRQILRPMTRVGARSCKHHWIKPAVFPLAAGVAPAWSRRVSASSQPTDAADCVNLVGRVVKEPSEFEQIIGAMTEEERKQFAESIRKITLRYLDSKDVRRIGIAALSRHYGFDFHEMVKEIDEDKSNCISRTEFRRFMAVSISKYESTENATRPTNRQLAAFALNSAIPMIVFGLLDNSIMIIGGDVVDDVIGSTFRLSTLACAAVANTFADVLGISIGNTVETYTGRIGLPQANLTAFQAELPIVRNIGRASASLGIFCGCVMGMFPLYFTDHEESDHAHERSSLARAISDAHHHG